MGRLWGARTSRAEFLASTLAFARRTLRIGPFSHVRLRVRGWATQPSLHLATTWLLRGIYSTVTAVFEPTWDPQPGSEIRSEDTRIWYSFAGCGRTAVLPAVCDRLSLGTGEQGAETILPAWWFDKARADIRAFGVPPETRWFVGGVPLYMFRRLAVWTLRWFLAVKPSHRFSCKVKVWMLLGGIAESYRLTYEAKRQRTPSTADLSAPQGFYGPASYGRAVIEKNRFDHLADSEANSRKLP